MEGGKEQTEQIVGQAYIVHVLKTAGIFWAVLRRQHFKGGGGYDAKYLFIFIQFVKGLIICYFSRMMTLVCIS